MKFLSLFIIALLTTTNLSHAAPKMDNTEVHSMVAALCSMLTNHISAVKPDISFNLHHWEIKKNQAGSLRVEGECARPVDPQGSPKVKPGQKFRLLGEPNTNNSNEVELIAQFDYAIGKVRFVREGVFDERQQNLHSSWRLRSINLVPLGSVHSDVVCEIPLLRWVVDALAPIQQTNFSVDRFRRTGNEIDLGMFSMRDLFTLDLWSTDQGRTLRVNMASYAKKAWGEMPRAERADAVFWSDNAQQMRGCSNFKVDGSRGNLGLEGCRGIFQQYKP